MSAGMAEVIAALDAVRSLHYADESVDGVLPIACAEGPCEHPDDDCPEVSIMFCYECSIPDVHYIQWPCPTIKAIERATSG